MDANATTPVLPQVLDAMQPFWSERFGNASAVHEHGRFARSAVDEAREQVAALIAARASEITFTSGGTESDNLALFGVLRPGDHLVTTAIEHHAVLHAAEALQGRGVELSVVPPDGDGTVSPERIRAALQPNTKLVSVMLANNETGVVQHLREISDAVHAGGALLHSDAVQAGGKMALQVMDLGCDLLTLSAHKMHGPQGAGALWTRKGVDLQPLLHGGPQERRRRAGTENLPAIVGFGAAAAAAASWMRSGGPEGLCQLRVQMERALCDRLPGSVIHGVTAGRLPNTVSIAIPGIDSESLIIALDLKGLAVSGGSACQSGAVEPSHVLRGMGLNDAEARSTVRISLSRLNTAEEVNGAAELMVAAVNRLRSIAA